MTAGAGVARSGAAGCISLTSASVGRGEMMAKWKAVQWEFLELRQGRNVSQGEVMVGEVGPSSRMAGERRYLHFFPLISRSWGALEMFISDPGELSSLVINWFSHRQRE